MKLSPNSTKGVFSQSENDRFWNHNMDATNPSRQNQGIAKMVFAATLTALCMFLLQHTSTVILPPRQFRVQQPGVKHVLVTGGAGYIGSHATLNLLLNGHRVTIVDNLSRGNMGAVRVLQGIAKPGFLQYINADLGDKKTLDQIFSMNAFDVVMHFAAVAYVGESMAEPMRYYHNITSNTLYILQTMKKHNVKRLIYSSTCATYGEPEKMPITENTPQVPINPYGKAKKMAEEIIRDYARTDKEFSATILRYFNVIGSDPLGRLGEMPRAELRQHGRISGACFDAALGLIDGLKILGTDYKTPDGTCIRDFIHVTDLVEAHIVAMDKQESGKVNVYNVGTGKGSSVKEFVSTCLKVTKKKIRVIEIEQRRPGDYAEVYSDPSKINTELGWKARFTNLEETLSMAWKWRQEHLNGYE